MQYYRLWIYSCNVVLGLTSAIFIVFAAFVVADVRLSLLEGVELYHPTFLYAYGALILQCGVVQTIGCLGAQRLSHKLLSLYWSLLLLLTLGDIGVGLYWVIHLEKIKVNLRPYLSREFIEKYSTDEAFTLRWNKIQSQDRCCGVDGPFDFDRFPVSHQSKQAAFSANSHVIVDVETGLLSLPESCCTLLYAPATVSSSSSSGTSIDKTYRVSHYPPEEEHPPFNDQSPESSITANDEHFNHHPRDFAGGGRRGGGRRSSRTAVSLPHKNDEPRMIRFVTNEQEEIGQPAVVVETDDEDDEGEDNDESRERKQYLGGFSQDSNNNETPYYLNYFHQSHGQQLAVVPDDHDVEHHREQQPAEHNHQSADSSLQKRDIKTYEPIHAHKVRHELHRKSQSSPLIDVKLLKNITYSLVVDRYRNLTDENFEYSSNNVSSSSSGESSINKSSRWYDGNLLGNETRDISSKSHIRKARKVDEVAVVPEIVEMHHSRQSRTNKTNKLFPSISFRVKSERRETRALSSVTQVPTLSSTPPIQTHKACHGQPEGLNHHNSYKKDLPDQRKTTKNKKGAGAKTSSPTAKILGAAWVHRKTTRTSASPTASAIPTTSASQIEMELTSAEITEKMKTSKIGILQKRHGSGGGDGGGDRNTETSQESLLAKRKSPSISFPYDASYFSSPPNSSKLTSSPFHKSKKSTTRRNLDATLHERHLIERRQKRQKRIAADTSADSSTDSTQHQQSDSLAISQSSLLTSNDKRRGTVEMSRDPNSFTKPYFFPVSSSALSSSSSSTSYLEAQSPQAAIISSSSTPYESNREWNEWSESNNNAYKGNTSDNEENSGKNNGNSSSVAQKKLYVYGVGCGVKLIEWVDRVSGILFILGFCIIGFVKTCFLVILRTEIREMIEKIHMIEPEEILSPSRTHSAKDRQSFHFVPHPLLQNPHRASTVSAHGLLLPTIKSPDGPTSMGGMAPSVSGGSYNRNRHYLRRASNIVGGDRSRSHSNETVNMSLLMTTSQGVEKGRSNPTLPTSAGGSSGTIANIEEKDPVSGLTITVPNSSSSTGGMGTSNSSAFGASRYLRRSSTCSSSANPVGYPYSGFDSFEPRPGPSSRFYQYFEPVYQTPHLYQQHHHHHYTRNRSHSRNMSCGAILPLASYRTSSAAAAASAALAASYRGNRNLSSATTATTTTTSNIPNSTGCSFSSTSKDETEMIISVSLEQIASSDQDEELAIAEEEAPSTSAAAATIDEEDVKDQEKKSWAAATACTDQSDNIKSTSKVEDNADTKLQTYSYSESANESGGSSSSAGAGGGGGAERDFQRRNGNNNVDLTNALPMSYIGTAV